eukprot:TRINITY_DN3895_c0_g1_i4.p1 TRINITY_DN3895_c0_g1~~TRINITY_DN3895_c0_g1_i4.p1  ORF type:complete len:309 (+),score=75.35 TRINITY_DN3895_c0_g1_i4:313-1239(+)
MVPPIPEKEYSLRFTPDLVQYRRRELGRFLERISSDPQLSQSQAFYTFLTVESMSLVRDTAQESFSEPQVSSFFSNMLNSVTTLASTLVTEAQEVDPEFTRQSEYLEDLKEKLELFHRTNTEYLLRRERTIACSIKLATSLGELEEFERQKAQNLADNYGKLAETLLNVANLDQTLSTQEAELFGDSLRDQARFTSAPQRLLNGRTEALRQYQLSQMNKIAKEKAVEEAPEKVELGAELNKLEQLEEENKQIFERKTNLLKQELEKYKKIKFRELRFALREVARENIEFGEQSIAQWKDFQRFLNDTK